MIKWLTGKEEAESVRLKIDILTAFEGIREIDYQGVLDMDFIPTR